jgi:hypothetical protein
LELEVEQLRAELAALREQEPVAYVHLVPDSYADNYDVRFWSKMPIGTKLYTAPKPTPEPLTPKGETVPQTVENLQAIMARDADEMLRMKEEISKLTQKLNQARQRQRPIPKAMTGACDELFALGWNACRQAMLAAKEPPNA